MDSRTRSKPPVILNPGTLLPAQLFKELFGYQGTGHQVAESAWP